MSTRHLVKPEQSPAEYRRDESSSANILFEIDLPEVLRILHRQKKIIIATTILIVLLTYVVISSLTPLYTASALVEINARQPRVVDYQAVLTGLSPDSVTIQTEIEVIRSRQIAQRTIEHLELNHDPEFNIALRSMGLLDTWRYRLADWLAKDGEIAAEGSQIELDQESGDAVGWYDGIMRTLANYLAPIENEGGTDDDKVKKENDRVVDEFLNRLTVESDGRSRIVQISFESENPKTAAAVANMIAEFYIVAQLEAKFEATKRATIWLNDRVLGLRKELVSKERAIEKYRAESGLIQGGANETLASQQISELNAQHVLEVARLAEAQARLRQANKLLDTPEGIESSVEVLQSTLIRELRGQEALLERQIAELSEEYGERHPRLINARAELHDLRTKIKLEVGRVIEGLRNEVAVAAARASSLAASLEQQKQEMALLNQSEVELRALELDANATRILLENLLERTKQTTSQEDFQQADADIVSSAVEPRFPSFPRMLLILGVTFFLAVALGILLAIFIEDLDLGFRSGEQISRILGLSSLGLLPTLPKISATGKAPHDYILNRPDSAFGEGIRTLYTNLLLSEPAMRSKVLLIASALPNEGKTTVVLSLARLLATTGLNVVVVDCDLRNPTAHKKLKIEPGPGLVECLTSDLSIDEVIQEDKASGAHILQAGKFTNNSPQQLDSVKMEKLLRQLARQYDLVLLDSAPLLAVSDSLFLMRLADKTVFVIRWAKTRRAAASLALKHALAARADVAGALLTMVDVRSNAGYRFGDSGVYHGEFRKYYSG